MLLKTLLLKPPGLEQHQGYSLVAALREEEEELGFCHDDLPTVVHSLATQKSKSSRKD